MNGSGPNVLWIMCDELRADAVGSYGNEHARIETPHIDSIAAAGTRFERFYVDSPVCVSARSAYSSGLLPTTSGIYHNPGHRLGPLVPAESFTTRFERAGWTTVNLGKEHVPTELRGYGESGYDGADQLELMLAAGEMRDRLGLITEGVGMNAATWPPGEPFPARRLTDNAVRWLEHERPADRPWLLRVSYLQPHTPVVPPEPWASRYDDEPWPDSFAGLGPTAGLSEFERVFGRIPPRELTPQQIVAAQSRYHGLTAWIDDQVGEILAAMDRLDLRGDTIIVFSSDHGAHLGELGGAYSKQTFSPWSHRVPFLLSWPGTLDAGTTNDELCSGVDLGPTLCDLAGVERAERCDGRSLVSDSEPDHLVSAIGYGLPGMAAMAAIGKGFWTDGGGWPQRLCVRTRRWRYDRSTRREGVTLDDHEFDAFLADCDADVREERNVIESHRDEAAGLESILADTYAGAPQAGADDELGAR